jgi:phage FluMu protein Com
MNHEVNCRHCDRYLFTAKGTTIIEQLPCPNTKCKAKLNIKIVTSDSTHAEQHYKFSTEETAPKNKAESAN